MMRVLLSMLFGLVLSTALLFAEEASVEQAAEPVPEVEVDAEAWARLVAQHDGRLKPLDKVARTYLLAFQGKSKLGEKSAIQWMMQLMLNPEKAYVEPVFKVRNPETLVALDLGKDIKKLYTFEELRLAFRPLLDNMHTLMNMSEEERSPVENELVQLSMRVFSFYDLSLSLTPFRADLPVGSDALAVALGGKKGEPSSYFRVTQRGQEVAALLEAGGADEAMSDFAMALQGKIAEGRAVSLKLIPPEAKGKEDWHAPWEMMMGHRPGPKQFEILQAFEKAVQSPADAEAINEIVGFVGYRKNIDREIFYENANLFSYSRLLYILSFFAIMLSWMFFPGKLWWASFATLAVGTLLHGWGIVLRMQIMERPPVATLYESIVFVGFVIAICGLWFEWRRRNGIGIFVACVAGIILHFIGFRYAVSEGDTMRLLVAVLINNFWLGTHVLTISIGYGTTFVAGLVAHVYLFFAVFKPDRKEFLNEVAGNVRGLSILALFFTMLGTILGGIWGDQSWGRFWGWDPKENGALLIVLWLVVMIHGRFAKKLKDIGFAVGISLGNICVAIAWFGVNLLSVGLHTYGFDDGAANNLAIFCGAEIAFAVIFGLWASARAKRVAS